MGIAANSVTLMTNFTIVDIEAAHMNNYLNNLQTWGTKFTIIDRIKAADINE